MKKIALISPLLRLKAGTFIEKHYQTYNEMAESSTENWDYNCTYELCPKALTGLHQILQLESMFISLATRPGGMMHDVLSAQDSISLAVHIELEDKACFDRLKLQQGDIIIFDDTQAYNYMTNAHVALAVITISNQRLGNMLPFFLGKAVHKIVDTDGKLGAASKRIWHDFTAPHPKTNYKEAEEEILAILRMIVTEQKPIAPNLTKGEEAAYAIREQVYHHMDGNLKVKDLVKQYHISERNLQNSFKSLFGFTPKVFMRNLKLNLVRHDLSVETTQETTVLKVAHKWGFFHMGRFSKYYKALFEESPHKTLQRTINHDKAFTGECVERQEDIIHHNELKR
jgi:AraC-like DNA-binding protein